MATVPRSLSKDRPLAQVRQRHGLAARPGGLIKDVQRASILLTVALEIARANENASPTGEDCPANLGDLLQEAYENGQLKGR